jgi:hypothetical protein
MNIWMIIKLIAGIISNLPFDASQDQVQSVVEECVEDIAADCVGVNNVGIPGDKWQELIQLLVPLIMWFRNNFMK